MTAAVSTAVPVKVIEQLPAERVQLVALREPALVDENVTTPVGVIAEPVLEVSVTLALHVDAWFVLTGLTQDNVRALVRLLALMVAGFDVELPLWARSPAKTALMFAVPLAVGVKFTLHVADAVVPTRWQVTGLKEPGRPVFVKATVS